VPFVSKALFTALCFSYLIFPEKISRKPELRAEKKGIYNLSTYVCSVEDIRFQGIEINNNLLLKALIINQIQSL
jgi:hypothetical protein